MAMTYSNWDDVRDTKVCERCQLIIDGKIYGKIEKQCVKRAFYEFGKHWGKVDGVNVSTGDTHLEAQKASASEEGHAGKENNSYICEKCGHINL